MEKNNKKEEKLMQKTLQLLGFQRSLWLICFQILQTVYKKINKNFHQKRLLKYSTAQVNYNANTIKGKSKLNTFAGSIEHQCYGLYLKMLGTNYKKRTIGVMYLNIVKQRVFIYCVSIDVICTVTFRKKNQMHL